PYPKVPWSLASEKVRFRCPPVVSRWAPYPAWSAQAGSPSPSSAAPANCWSTSRAEPSAIRPVLLVSSRPTPEPHEHRSLEGQSTLNEPVHAGGGPGAGGAGVPLGEPEGLGSGVGLPVGVGSGVGDSV